MKIVLLEKALTQVFVFLLTVAVVIIVVVIISVVIVSLNWSPTHTLTNAWRVALQTSSNKKEKITGLIIKTNQ